jgi:hypothetical protein
MIDSKVDVGVSDMENEDDSVLIGTFTVSSGTLIISDPCYPMDEEHLGAMSIVLNTKNGEWEAYVTYNEEGRVAELVIYHEDLEPEILGTYESPENFVDSGQMGIFDYDAYPDCDLGQEQGEYGEPGFYDDCCEASDGDAGIVRGTGVISSSGYGDGVYSAYVTRSTDGYARCVSVVFIDSDEDEEESGEFICEDCKKELN